MSHTGLRFTPTKERFDQMADERVEAVVELWKAHMAAPFPPRMRGMEVAGLDMVLLDSNTAGCVITWLRRDNVQLDPLWHQAIASCLDELNLVLPLLTEPYGIQYYNRLREIAALLCDEQPTTRT